MLLNITKEFSVRSKLSWGGLLKISLDRFRVYVTYIQLLMILQIYLKQEGWHTWYLLLIPLSLIVIYFDTRYMLRGEQQANFDIHPYMPKMRDDIEAIRKEIEQWKQSTAQIAEHQK